MHTYCSMRVPPFGNLRFIRYLLLTAAYRSLSRPSSASGAKASALCSFLLDQVSARHSVAGSWFTLLKNFSEISGFLGSNRSIYTLRILMLSSLNSLFNSYTRFVFDFCFTFSIQFSMCMAPPSHRGRRITLIGYRWWRIQGSNLRPPACKAGALPAELIPQNRKLIVQRQSLLRKEVIQPLVLERLPCYDFTPVIDFALGKLLLVQLRAPPTSMV